MITKLVLTLSWRRFLTIFPAGPESNPLPISPGFSLLEGTLVLNHSAVTVKSW